MSTLPKTAPALLLGLMTMVGGNAYAATISVASADCGTPVLLGLTFVTTTGSNIGTGSAGCPEVGIGAIIDPGGSGGGGGSPLYGLNITSIGFLIIDPSGHPPSIVVDLDSALGAGMTIPEPGGGFLLTDPKGISIVCRGDFDAAPLCFPHDAVIFFSGFTPGTEFRVTLVNGVAAVPEPATLSLLAGGLAAAAWRRRRRSR
jgi:hypothetical protein